MTSKSVDQILQRILKKHPELESKVNQVRAKYKHLERSRVYALKAMERYKYRLAKAEEKLGETIPDRTVEIVILNEKITEIRMPDKTEFAENLIGKSHDAPELEYFIETLENQGYVMNIQTSKKRAKR